MTNAHALPNEVQTAGDRHYAALTERHPNLAITHEARPSLIRVMGLSDFVARQLQQYPDSLADILAVSQGQELPDGYSVLLQEKLSQLDSEAQLHAALRQFRHHHMALIATRDLLNLQPIEDSLAQVSALADALILAAYQWLYQSLCQRYGSPDGPMGPQPLFILGMGKLGGRELNFSSDIDLIFTYPHSGETNGDRKPIEHQVFFTKLAQKLIAALHQTTADGQVFRVDMRLRPFGESGPLVSHFAALEDYYQEQGREWERFAMIKARILNPDEKYSRQLSGILTPFTYRRYLDFGSIESLRDMKRLISQEVRRRKLHDNIKLGAGGIREVEFIVQSFQLIRGGREVELRGASLLETLRMLRDAEIFSDDEIQQLREAYLSLRKVEHCLQQFDDAQTQTLPESSLEQYRLAAVMGEQDYASCAARIREQMHTIHGFFDSVIGEEEREYDFQNDDDFHALWNFSMAETEALSVLENYLTPDAAQAFLQPLNQFKQDVPRSTGDKGQSVLTSLMPPLLHACIIYKDLPASELLERVLTVLNAVLGRTTYLQLLNEHPAALQHLMTLCATSPWIARELARFPILLDELLHPTTLFTPLPLEDYLAEIRQFFLRVDPDDLELQMDMLRQFKLSQQLKTAAADITGVLPVMAVSDHLTYLAESVIHQVVEFAWQQMTAKYGAPPGRHQHNKGFSVIGYGKLGGWELGYGSDLDLVFLHDEDTSGRTDGEKSIETGVFYTRLAQRVVHLFSTKMGLGELYEVDMRLRPSGNAGLLVCHIHGFSRYQQEEAWTWEHQALVRARVIVGDDAMTEAFQQIRREVLCATREAQVLAEEVQSMRAKMRDHLDKSDDHQFDLKQGRGGITDIEFLVQYWVLAHAGAQPALVRWSDNVRILADLHEHGVITGDDKSALTDAYLTYRNVGHRLALAQQDVLADPEQFNKYRTAVQAIWHRTFGAPAAD